MLSDLNIKHIQTAPYHPQSNGKNERQHRTMNDILAKHVNEENTDWDEKLYIALQGIRMNINDSSKFSPFELLYGRDALLPIDNLLLPRRKYLGEDIHEKLLESLH
jgi:transposase InsO family protein